jgi:hypothetical protein
MAAKAERIACTTIERHLLRGDIYTNIDGVTFVIVFAQLAEEPARMKCALIGQQITKALLGDDGAQLLSIESAAMRIDRSPNINDMALNESAPSTSDPAAAGKSQPSRRSPSRVESEPNLRFAYRPVWDRSRNVVSTYACFARPADVTSGDGVAADENPAVVIQRDLAVRDRVLDDLVDLIADDRRLLLSLPVHWETLGSGTRHRDYLGVLGHRLDAEARKLLVVEVIGLPNGVPPSRLVQLVGPLRQSCRAVILQVPLDIPDLANLHGCGAAAASCDLAGHPGPEAVAIQQLNRFCREAERAGLSSCLSGAKSRSLVAAAVGAGFRYISGDGVAPPIDNPSKIVDFALADLYRPFIQAGGAEAADLAEAANAAPTGSPS